MKDNDLMSTLRRMTQNGLGAPLLMILMLAMMMVPMPPIALDMLFTFNIALSLVVMMVVIYALRPLGFRLVSDGTAVGDLDAAGAQCGLDTRGAAGRP